MPSGFRVPTLPRFGAPQVESPPAVRVKATSVHGIPIELRVNPGAQSFSRSSSYDTPRHPSLAAFARALDPTSDGLTVEVEAFCAPAAPVRAPNALLAPKVPTPNPLPDRAAGSAPAAAPVPAVPVGAAPIPPSAAPPPTLEELAALAEIRESATAPQAVPPGEAPFPPPPLGKQDAPTQAPKSPPVPPQGASLSYGHEVFDRMAPPMALTFDVGDVSLQRRFSQMDSRLDREARRVRSPRAPNNRPTAASLDDQSLAQDLASMRWSMPLHHSAGAGTQVMAGPAPAVAEAPPIKAAPVVDVIVAKGPVKETTPAASPATTAQVVDAAALIAGDVIVACEPVRDGVAPVTRTLLFIGDGQVVEAASTGMAVRPLAQALVGVECALALRNNPGAWSPTAGDQSSVLVYIGHLKAPATK
ncbi:MAG TPA: hypothetical protein VFD64_17475 [Gemmatimonadaceae bacterium]|nr:hypothetical protein [Gemmatimonadaceae bacterium]